MYAPRQNWDSPQPPTRRLVCLLPPVSGGRGTLAGEKGVGRVPIPTRGIHCGTLYMYVLCGLSYYSHPSYTTDYRANTFHGGFTVNLRLCSWLRFSVSWKWDILSTSWCGQGATFSDAAQSLEMEFVDVSEHNLKISSTWDLYFRFAFLHKMLFTNKLEFFFIGWLFCVDFWNLRGGDFLLGFPPFIHF